MVEVRAEEVRALIRLDPTGRARGDDTMLPMDHPPDRIVVFAPNPVGDAVMFTPTLRAIHARFPSVEIVLAARAGAAAVLTPNPWSGRVLELGACPLHPVPELRRGKFDLAVLGPNSFLSAVTARLSGAKRRLGYSRDGRGWLLTDRLPVPRDGGGRMTVPPAIDYYLKLAEVLGADVSDRRMELGVAEADADAARTMLLEAGCEAVRPLVMLNPGAGFGPSKLYPADRFAAVADALVKRRGVQVVINAGPGEQAVAEAVAAAMTSEPLLNLARVRNSLGLVKALAAKSDVVITNDTGARHIAAALGAGVVTIFGSTDPDRTIIDCPLERIIRTDVPCGPCQKKRCGLPPEAEHHQCMANIAPETVARAAEELLDAERTIE